VVSVTKFDGSKQPFNRMKVIQTCLRLGATEEVAEKVAELVEAKLYEGIQTRRILQLTRGYVRVYHPPVEGRVDLRRAISLLRPKPDWERFAQLLLEEHGYRVMSNQLVRGRCVEHEIDAVAMGHGETLLVEVKHHYQYHVRTTLDVTRGIRATYEDIVEGSGMGLNEFNFTKPMIICNTRFSDQARSYAECRGIAHLGWKTPPQHGLESMIEQRSCYPITLLRGAERQTLRRMADHGIVMLKQLTAADVEEFSRRTGLGRERVRELKERAEQVLVK